MKNFNDKRQALLLGLLAFLMILLAVKVPGNFIPCTISSPWDFSFRSWGF